MSRRREDTSIPPANKRTFLGRLVVTYFQMSALRIVCPRGKKTRCLTTFMFYVGKVVSVGLQMVNGGHRLYRLQTVAESISNKGHVSGAILLRLRRC